MAPYGDDELRDHLEEEYNRQLMHGGDEFPKFTVQVVTNVTVFASCGADALEMAHEDVRNAIMFFRHKAMESGWSETPRCYAYDTTNAKVIGKANT